MLLLTFLTSIVFSGDELITIPKITRTIHLNYISHGNWHKKFLFENKHEIGFHAFQLSLLKVNFTINQKEPKKVPFVQNVHFLMFYCFDGGLNFTFIDLKISPVKCK